VFLRGLGGEKQARKKYRTPSIHLIIVSPEQEKVPGGLLKKPSPVTLTGLISIVRIKACI
jgi:hypothetical protein